MSFYDWSTTASNNGAVDATINWAEFQDPSTVNDSARAMMARVAEWRKDVAPTRSSTGSGNAYAVASEAGGSTAYRDGEIVTFIADRANTAGCTLNVNARGAKPFRPAIGVDFKAGEIQINQAIIAFYRSATEEFIGIGSGYHVNAMTTGLLSQSIAARLIKIGTPVLSLAPTAPAGYIRLTEATQTRNKSDWPELDAWLSSISYPWGSTSTTFNLPPAAGYVLRFAGTTSSIDPDGPRVAGATQTDLVKAHTHTGTTDAAGSHSHYIFRSLSTNGALSTSSRPASQGNYSNTNDYAIAGAASGPDVGVTTTEAAHQHTFTTAANTGAETRPKNVAMHVDIFASSQQSAGTLAMFGFPYAWDTGTTAADPGSARVRGNNATLASITALYINETDAWGVDIGSVLGAITNGSVIRLSKVGAQANTLIMTVSGSITDSGTYRAIPVTVTTVNGSFAANDSLAFELAGGAGATGDTGPQGPQGDTGAAGADGADGTDPGIRWRFDTSTTTNADPGTGDLRLNNATLASVTEIAISYSSGETGNPSVETFVKAWDDSTTTGARGTLIIKKASAPQNFAIYTITSAITDGTTYGQFTLSYVTASGSFSSADVLAVQFMRTGDKGADGAGTGDVVGPASSVDGEIALFDSTTGKLLKRASTTGLLKAASGVLSAAASGTDYAPATSGTSILKGNGSGGFSSASAGTDYAPATSGTSILKGNGSGGFSSASAGTDYYNPGGTDVAVADGGTGSSTAEGAATNLGLGTGNSPQFAGVNIGHASDTTLERLASGVPTVEGNVVDVLSYTTTATAAGITTLTVTSTRYQFFTGTTTQTVVLPVTSTLTTGFTFVIVNNSTGNVTVQSSGENNILVMGPGSEASFVCILTSGTTAASWQAFTRYQNTPINSRSAAYTTVLSDAGKTILHPTADNNARTFTIDSNANVPYPVGTVITFVNQINTVTISITSDTLTLSSAGSTGSRTLAANGIATAIKVASTSWMISGSGLT